MESESESKGLLSDWRKWFKNHPGNTLFTASPAVFNE